MGDFIRSKMVKKRKTAPCVWCGESCEKGEIALAVTFNDNGRIATCHWHPECDKAYQKYANENKAWGEPFEPYEFARGSSLCKHDYRIANQEIDTKDNAHD